MQISLKYWLAAIFATLHLASIAQPSTSIDLQGHRGARGLLPENTLVGFAEALKIGVTTIETDIAITKDKVLVISHDPLLNPDITRDAQGKFLSAPGPAIMTLTAAELEKYDVGRIQPGTAYSRTFSNQKPVDGTRVPTLKQVFDLVRRSGNNVVRFAIETKVTPHAPNETLPLEEYTRLVIAAIREAGMEKRSSILSFDWRTLQVVRKEAPEIPTVYLSMQRPQFIDNIAAGNPAGSTWTAGFQIKDHGSVPKMIKAAGGYTWSVHWNDADEARVKEAQSLGLQVLVWTVNDPAQMRRFMDMGVNGIVTDRPDLLRAEMEKRGLPLPRTTPVN